MVTQELLVNALVDDGIATEVVGDAIYRFTQSHCEWMVPQYLIDSMLEQGVTDTKDYIYKRMFDLVSRLEDKEW